MSAFVSVAGSLLFSAVVLGVLVLSVRPRPGTDARTITEAAQKYARRIGIVALATVLWLPSLLSPALQAAGGELWWNDNYSPVAALLQLGLPTLLALAVLTLGELTWPGPLGSVRSAVLQHRSVRSLLPRYMTCLALLFLTLSFLILANVLVRDASSEHTVSLLTGWLPWVLLTTAAVFGILKLISVRPMVPGASAEADAALRRASAHRVLRVAAALLIFLSASGGVFLATHASPMGSSPGADILRNISLPAYFLGLIALLKRAPRVPLPEGNAAAGQRSAAGAEPQSAFAVKSVAASLRHTVAAPLAAVAAGTAVMVFLSSERFAGLLAVACGALVFLVFGAITEFAQVRRTRRTAAPESMDEGTLEPEELAFIRPPRWLSWTATGAGVLVLLIQGASALLGPSVDAAARSFAESIFAPHPTPANYQVPFFDGRFALGATALVLLLPLLSDLLARRIETRPAFPVSDRAVDLRLRRVALFRNARITAAVNVSAVGICILNLYLSSPWARTFSTEVELAEPLTWLAPLLEQFGSGATVWMLAALVIAFRQFGPSHFPDEARFAERADLPPARRA